MAGEAAAFNFEEDLVEEIARLHGYDQLPAAPMRLTQTERIDVDRVQHLRALREQLVMLGYHEAITYSFVSEAIQNTLFPGKTTIKLRDKCTQNT